MNLVEKNIDIVKYEEDPSDDIANALNPAEVIAVQFGEDEEEKECVSYCPRLPIITCYW